MVGGGAGQYITCIMIKVLPVVLPFLLFSNPLHPCRAMPTLPSLMPHFCGQRWVIIIIILTRTLLAHFMPLDLYMLEFESGLHISIWHYECKLSIICAACDTTAQHPGGALHPSQQDCTSVASCCSSACCPVSLGVHSLIPQRVQCMASCAHLHPYVTITL